MTKDKAETGKAGAVELEETELDDISGGANRREHDHLTDHNWQLEIEGVTTGAAKASSDIVIKGKKILQN